MALLNQNLEFSGVWQLSLRRTIIKRVNEVTDSTQPVSNDSRRFTLGRGISLLLLLIIAIFWIWALSPLAPSGHPDKLDSSDFAIQAKALCTDAEKQLQEIPFALSAASPEERADQIDKGTAIYRNLLANLSAHLLSIRNQGSKPPPLDRACLLDLFCFDIVDYC